MCGIVGWVDYSRDLRNERMSLEKMTKTLKHRGPDDWGLWVDRNVGLGHTRLAVIDPENGIQPMKSAETLEKPIPLKVLSYNGEVYNFKELKKELSLKGHRFRTNCDTEVVLHSFLEWGPAAATKFNGIFSLAIWDSQKQELILCRDRLGVKPLYYFPTDRGLIFASEPKGILSNPHVQARASREEICDILLFLRTPGRAPFMGMSEVKPGHFLRFNKNQLIEKPYWRLEAKEHSDDVKKSVSRVRELLEDSVHRQMQSDVPLCSLLSGGLDSSAVSALAKKFRGADEDLSTFVVDFVGQTDSYKSDPIRPSPDLPFAQEVADFISSQHHQVILAQDQLSNPSLRDRVLEAWDTPYNFADLDVSLFLLFESVVKSTKVALSGEAADELFGGYLWFRDQNAINSNTFPWLNLAAHKGLKVESIFNQEFLNDLHLNEYRDELYQNALSEVPRLKGEKAKEAKLREIAYLTLTRWLPILLEKKDRMSMAVGLEGRVPFCDHRLVEYVFNIPWEIKNSFSIEKGVLREAVRGLLPDSVTDRKKAAYPSVQNPKYDHALLSELKKIVSQSSAGTNEMSTWISKEGVDRLVEKSKNSALSEFERVLVETVVRTNHWLEKYNVEIVNWRNQ